MVSDPIGAARNAQEAAYIVRLTGEKTANVALWEHRARCGFDGVKVTAHNAAEAISKARAGVSEDPTDREKIDREPMLPPGSYLFGVEQLEEALLSVADAVNTAARPETLGMPQTELKAAVANRVRQSIEIFGPASQRALELERGDLRGRIVEKIRDYNSRAEHTKPSDREEAVRLERCANVLNNVLWEADEAAARADVADVAADAEDPLFRRAAEQDAVRRREVGISAEGVDLTRSIVCKAGEHARCKMPVCRCSCHGAKQ